ncbi:MAG: BrnT family toxin [Rhodopseudomonas sp.]|uniref:BrnT family toxin n=1 Tax=Rhodopseudomonas sp. TaxID=1078 RepID=UPI0039E46B39
MELRVRAIVRDERFDYGEDRFRAYGDIDGLAYCLVFTFRDGLRPISLRRAHDKEMRRHAP